MQIRTRIEPWWSALIVWGVVNAVKLAASSCLTSLFSGAALLMGLPMFWLNRIVWLDGFAGLSHTGRRLQEDAAVKR